MTDCALVKTPRPLTGISARRALLPALLGLALLFCCYPASAALVYAWTHQDLYSYGYLIPVITAIWVRHERERFACLVPEPSLAGGTLLLAPLVLLLAGGTRSSTAVIQQLALAGLAPALVLLMLGRKFVKALGAQLAYLFLTVPVLDEAVAVLHPPFQLFAAWSAEQVLQAAHIPVLRAGRFLELPSVTLEVADVCSGVRFLVSTLVLSVPLVFITQKTRSRRIALFSVALLVSVLANPVRVVLIGFWAYYGSGDVHGPGHVFQGYVVYMAGLALLFTAARVLQQPAGLSPSKNAGNAAPARPGTDGTKRISAFLIAIALLVAAGWWQYAWKPEPVALKQSFDYFPGKIGDWEGQKKAEEEEAVLPGADARLTRLFRNAAGREVEVQVSYFSWQERGKKLVSNTVRFPQGEESTIELVNDAGEPVSVAEATASTGDGTTKRLSWYRINGRTVPGRYRAKLLTFAQGLLYGKTNGAYVSVEAADTLSSPGGSFLDAELFTQQLMPVLDEFIP